MKTVEFTQTVRIDFLQGKGEEVFEQGTRHALEDDRAERWIRRGKAVDVSDTVVAPAPAKEVVPAPPAPSASQSDAAAKIEAAVKQRKK